MASIVNTTSNPTTKQLAAGEYWNDTSPTEDIKTHASAVVSIHSDQPSAVDGIECRWSMDHTNWDFYDRFTMSLSDPDTIQSLDGCLTKTINVEHRARYFGIRYTNGPISCSGLRIQTVHKAMPQSLAIENNVQTTVSGLMFDGENLKTTAVLSVGDLTLSSDVSITNAVTISGYSFQDNRLLTDISGTVTVLNPLTVTNLTIGTEGNLWNNESLNKAGFSNIVNIGSGKFISIFGHCSNSDAVLVMYVSNDGVNFYASYEYPSMTTLTGLPYSYSNVILFYDWIDVFPSDFYLNTVCSAKYIRLYCNTAATITATVAVKS